MSVVGIPTEWSDLIDPMLPQIIGLVIGSWQEMPPPSPDEKEDNITIALCRTLRQNRTARSLPFQIHTQQVELDPMPGEDLGRLDIVFVPMVPREDIYFCLESKRLNALIGGQRRALAAEYVQFGMVRFVSGQYSRAVRHGGMIGYVLDGNVSNAMTNVETNIQQRHQELRMEPPGAFLTSTMLKNDLRVRETHHQRTHEMSPFRIHHLFMGTQ